MLVGRHTAVPVSFNPPSLRRDDESVRAQLENPSLAYQPPRFVRCRGVAGGRWRTSPLDRHSDCRADRRVPARVRRGRAHERCRARSRSDSRVQQPSFDLAKVVPTVIVRNEDYGRICRLLADKTAVELEFNIVNHVYPEGRRATTWSRRSRARTKPTKW